jgi:hypothetical protein
MHDPIPAPDGDPRYLKAVVYNRTGDTAFMFDPETQVHAGDYAAQRQAELDRAAHAQAESPPGPAGDAA